MKRQLLQTKILISIVALVIILASCGKKEEKHSVATQSKVAVKVATADLKEYPVVHSFSG